MRFTGPAIDREIAGTTIVVASRQPRRVDGYGNLITPSRPRGRRETTARDDNDPITLEIIQNSLQAISDEMFAAMRKTAMSAIIYEVLDMGTGITDADGEIASSGAGIPAFIGVLDKAVKAILGSSTSPATSTRATSSSPTTPTTAASPISTTWSRDAGVRRRRDRSPGRPTSPTGTTSAAWCRARCRPRPREIFQEGLRLPAVKLIDEGRSRTARCWTS